MLKELDCETEYDVWQKAQPLDDEMAARLDRLADETDSTPAYTSLTLSTP